MSISLYYLLYFFLAVGAKLLLAALMIYLLLPDDQRCDRCDGETLLIRPSRPGRLGARLTAGRVSWRWCPRCGWEGLARGRPAPAPDVGVARGADASSRS